MLKPPRQVLAVIGAGPKGLAVAVKAKVLAEFGLPVDQVVLIERHSVAANWSGEAGYTNGAMALGTSPEKDVVFPLETAVVDARVTRAIRKRLLDFTWMAYLAEAGTFSDWIDRGRPAPCHRLWATYLQWVAAQLAPEVTVQQAEVLGIDLDKAAGQWRLRLRAAGKVSSETLSVDRLMLTGPGQTRADFPVDQNGAAFAGGPSRVYDLDSYWRALKSGVFPTQGRLAIIGAGENAASALLSLSRDYDGLAIDLISPKGFIATRAESYYENQIYSQPERNGWKELALDDRRDFIERTDLGVFSVHAMHILNDERRHNILRGRVTALRTQDAKVTLSLSYQQHVSERVYDFVLLATGFDYGATLKAYMSPAALSHLESQLDAPLSQEVLGRRIKSDLSVAGVTPALHLPMLAGLSQGPGFANLSCLGRLADRILMDRPVTEECS